MNNMELKVAELIHSWEMGMDRQSVPLPNNGKPVTGRSYGY